MFKDNTITPTIKAGIANKQGLWLKAFRLMCQANHMAATYEANRSICKYVHSTSRGHEAIQIAAGLLLQPWDYASPYYRDDSMLLAMGFTPLELMFQLLAKGEDPFSGGRSYYSHPGSRVPNKPLIPHQSSATGMQVIPATGMAQGIKYLEKNLPDSLPAGPHGELPVVLCSLGDGSVTEGEVSEAWQSAILWELPVIYLVQDNEWGISASSAETRAMDAYEYAAGFKGMERMRVDGSDFEESYHGMEAAINYVREERKPVLVHACVPLLGHHTSGVRKEWYRTEGDLALHNAKDPLPRLKALLLSAGIPEKDLLAIERDSQDYIEAEFDKARISPDPDPRTVKDHVFAPAAVTVEKGNRTPEKGAKVMMVDAALHAMEEILRDYPEAIFFGQDVGRRLGGVFREAATLAEKFGDHRVYNTAIQEAYIVGATAGLSAVGVKPIVEIQFADYIYPGFNQLVTEISKSCYLSYGKFPVQTLIRIPIGAYGGGGPYHSGSIESTLLTIKGIKVVYPSNAADMKGLMKAAFLDPNPVVMLEHKGLYWSKVPGTQGAIMVEPDADYQLPLGKGRVVVTAHPKDVKKGSTCCIITYGMGVYWATNVAAAFPGQVEVIDLRTLFPLDEQLVFSSVSRHGKCLVLTEEQLNNSFAQALAGRIQQHCFRSLDAPVFMLGALDLPAVPINTVLENEMLPNPQKLKTAIKELLAY
ncbi:alpha-ketoacid dehydrogenase subunit alpha/beta [Chitinophaga sancti]|uniref:3-methyl-2-oxobutanoate dehydrogenase (2-methylpropanoyl-transferring) n=1 Tax=Chitinophaga sancti TaxID=1004 RepID=A0A1K1Q8G5_9BACT|nr:alpha-ketoacid dehydrogenase subunit alpha/beta [Chitinophaga sancti]WQD61220.1 thiamine pyrophosphate-dependent enzyme [Chitinophaga sancti]WQG86653.1 thiamine pyrophosphate-dependent enzyme [Chitinophaga sancti]SFW55971.1 2-oxoisovalerate dehydrogenase E1 component [Chitinophaga sancti]